jgi:carbonic anhydrase
MKTIMKPRYIPALVCAILALSLASCSDKKESVSDDQLDGHAAHWSYEAGNGPDEWGTIDPEWILCAEGLAQSPIDLANATVIELPAAEIDSPSEQEIKVLNQTGAITVLDNGHTIQINVKTGETLTLGDKSDGDALCSSCRGWRACRGSCVDQRG